MAPQINGLGFDVGLLPVHWGSHWKEILGTVFCLASGQILYRFSHKILELIVYRSTNTFPTLTLQMRNLREVKWLTHGYKTTYIVAASGLESKSHLPVQCFFHYNTVISQTGLSHSVKLALNHKSWAKYLIWTSFSVYLQVAPWQDLPVCLLPIGLCWPNLFSSPEAGQSLANTTSLCDACTKVTCSSWHSCMSTCRTNSFRIHR